jgi:uncharacterized membrane protein YfcA
MITTTLVQVSAVFLAAGVVKGISGMGLPTLSMALLGLWMRPSDAAALMVLPSLLTNVAQCLGPHWRMLVRRLWPLWLCLAAAAVWSPLPDVGSNFGRANLVLGGVLVAYGAWGLVRSLRRADSRDDPAVASPLRPDRVDAAIGAVAGLLTGALTAATGVFVLPLVPYLQTLRLDKTQMIQALGLSFTIATLSLAVRLGNVGLATWTASPVDALLALAAAFGGMALGARIRNRLDAPTFQRALYAVFAVLGLLMLAK